MNLKINSLLLIVIGIVFCSGVAYAVEVDQIGTAYKYASSPYTVQVLKEGKGKLINFAITSIDRSGAVDKSTSVDGRFRVPMDGISLIDAASAGVVFITSDVAKNQRIISRPVSQEGYWTLNALFNTGLVLDKRASSDVTVTYS